MQYRTSRLLQSIVARLQKHTQTLASFGAWNWCLNHLLTLAESHIESVILAKFIEAVQKYFLNLATKFIPFLSTCHIYKFEFLIVLNVIFSCLDASSQAALKLLCNLYALDRIWKDIGTYRNVDYVAPNESKV